MTDKFNTLKQLLAGGVTLDTCLFCSGDDTLIVRGATEEQSFNLPFSFDLIDSLLITYKQNGSIILEYCKDDVKIADFDNTLFYYTLSEADTYKFREGQVDIQLKISLKDKSTITSEIYHVDVEDTLSNKRLTVDSTKCIALECNVESNNLTITELTPIYSGNDNYYICKLNLDSTWKNFSPTVTFKDEWEHEITCVLYTDRSVEIPSEVIEKPGRLYLTIEGSNIIDGDLIKKRTNISNSIRVFK